MKLIMLNGPLRTHAFKCQGVTDGVPINPVLPVGFSDTANGMRPDRHLAWWGVPYVQTEERDDPNFRQHWKEGKRYDVYCLDGGCWDRPTCWGCYGTLLQAVALARKRISPVLAS